MGCNNYIYNWYEPLKNWSPGKADSKRIQTENNVPIIPAIKPNQRYKVQYLYDL